MESRRSAQEILVHKEDYGILGGAISAKHKTVRRYGSAAIPDIAIVCGSGRVINPRSFAGHALVVLFAPLDAPEPELAAFRHHCDDFVKCDAWLLTFADTWELNSAGEPHMLTAADPERRAWVGFRDLTEHPEELDRGDGATFLFARGGTLQRYWHGPGHVHEVLDALKAPSAAWERLVDPPK